MSAESTFAALAAKERNGTPPVPWRRLLLTLHILTAVGLFGTDMVLLTLGVFSLLGADPVKVYPAAHLIAAILVQPLAVVALITGATLALLTSWGLLQYWWTAIKLAITVVLTIVVMAVLVPRLAAAADAASAAAPPTFAAAERLPLVVAPVIASLLLVLNVALAVYKPGWRLRGRAADVHDYA